MYPMDSIFRQYKVHPDIRGSSMAMGLKRQWDGRNRVIVISIPVSSEPLLVDRLPQNIPDLWTEWDFFLNFLHGVGPMLLASDCLLLPSSYSADNASVCCLSCQSVRPSGVALRYSGHMRWLTSTTWSAGTTTAYTTITLVLPSIATV